MKRRTTTSCSSSRSPTTSSTTSTKDPGDDWRVYGVVIAVAVGCYVNGIDGDFVHDDIPAVSLNRDVLGLNPVFDMFSNDFWGTPMSDPNSHKSYRPLTTLTFRANYITFGLRPLWFHVSNVLLHVVACVLFTRVCLAIAGLERGFATAAGLLFAVHPIHTEAVTGIVGRADVLAAIFFLISLLVYHGQGEGEPSSVWLSVLLGGLSMLAKETGVTVFIVNLLYDLYKSWPTVKSCDSQKKRSFFEIRWTEETSKFGKRGIKLLISLGVLLAVRLALLQGSLPKFSQQDNPTAFHPNLYVRLLTFCYLAAFNWWLCLCPNNLSHDWQMGSVPLLTSMNDQRNLVTFIAMVAALLLTYRVIIDFEHHRHVPLVLGLLLLVLPFMPATNLVVTVGFVVAERVLYIPSCGSCILTVYGAQLIWEKFPRQRLTIIFFGTILLLAGVCRTYQRNRDWKSRESLLRSGLEALPHNAKMHYNFANFLRDSSKPDLAITYYQQALRLWPSYASAHNNLGTLLTGTEHAELHFLAAIRYSSDHVNAHYNLGQLYRKSNRTYDSIRMLERCIHLEPLYTPAYLELVKLKQGRTVGKLLKRVTVLQPRDPYHLTQYADWLTENGHLPWEGLKYYQRALRSSETDPWGVIGAAKVLRSLGQYSRMHQVIQRWQLMIRIAAGGLPLKSDVYLRDYTLKIELRNRAMVYDTCDHCMKKDTIQPRQTLKKPSIAPTLQPEEQIESIQIPKSQSLSQKICNKSEHSNERILKTSDGRNISSGPCKSRRWPEKSKPKYKTKSEQSVTPLLVPNLLDSL